MTDVVNHIANRDVIVDRLRQELVGPDPRGESLRTDVRPEFEDPKADRERNAEGQPGYVPRAVRPWRDAATGEEILTQDRPRKRYGVGVLYPRQTEAVDPSDPTDDPDAATEVPADPQEVLTPEGARSLSDIDARGARGSVTDDGGEVLGTLAGTNAYLPSSMGLSFLLEVPADGALSVEFAGARYLPFDVGIGKNTRRWWKRQPLHGSARESFAALKARTGTPSMLTGTFRGVDPVGERPAISLAFHLVVRPYEPTAAGLNRLLVTLSVVNRTTDTSPSDVVCVFQSELSVSLEDSSSARLSAVVPYPRPPGALLDDEEEEIELLYRNVETFGVGHGCAADWQFAPGVSDRAYKVQARSLPTFETPSITPEIKVGPDLRPASDGKVLQVRMAALGGLVAGEDGLTALKDVVRSYALWIDDRRKVALEPRHAGAAARHLSVCDEALRRMRGGLEALEDGGADAELIRTAFRLANHAMCLQRIRTKTRDIRRFEWRDKGAWAMSAPHPQPPTDSDLLEPSWRPFQIAFFLMALPSVAFSDDSARSIVDLIWFPTGGGKTEAYLGLVAFSVFLRRLRALKHKRPREDVGVQALMRYTLRLLTAQQFQRAAALFCAMEHLRRTRPGGVDLGAREFALGMWSGATPNSRTEARKAYDDLVESGRARDNIIVLERCPWCRAEMGAKPRPGRQKGHSHDVLGYRKGVFAGSRAETVVAACSDPVCAFKDALPLRFIDDDIYDKAIDTPSMIIGTVDKFAMLAWRPHARILFGRDDEGRQAVSPPGLIIQDELHLVSGPLGTMVGLFETTIEHLCTDARDGAHVPPKIVSSTATIRSYRDQVRRLFGRDAALFPPPGIDADDSFFARYAVDDEKRLLPGRKFVGVHAPGLGSVQTTQVRTFSALLQAPQALPEGGARDPWWTLLTFYNSLRELGGGLTLFHSDVPDYLWGATRQREALKKDDLRKLYEVEELTGRLQNHEVVSVMSKLELPVTGDQTPVDVCLASNIIEVGVDIDRLSLLTVVGQPKSTAQYIQVTGRIGRRWEERPGLVVTVYSPSKPRDRSHFERFRTYHQQLYAQVEPTSVTPFSPPALERGLHGALLAFMRQIGPISRLAAPNIADPVVAALYSAFEQLATTRLALVQTGLPSDLALYLQRRRREWVAWQPQRWDGVVNDEHTDYPLMRWPGRYAQPSWRRMSWLTATSMRNVDDECRVEITPYYATIDGAAVAAAAESEDSDG